MSIDAWTWTYLSRDCIVGTIAKASVVAVFEAICKTKDKTTIRLYERIKVILDYEKAGISSGRQSRCMERSIWTNTR